MIAAMSAESTNNARANQLIGLFAGWVSGQPVLAGPAEE